MDSALFMQAVAPCEALEDFPIPVPSYSSEARAAMDLSNAAIIAGSSPVGLSPGLAELTERLSQALQAAYPVWQEYRPHARQPLEDLDYPTWAAKLLSHGHADVTAAERRLAS
jgi:hypothetical protein